MADTTSEDLRRARAGDREALARLLGRTQTRLSTLAAKRLGPGLVAKLRPSDVLQSAYLDVLASVNEFNGSSEEEFVAWVARIIENNLRDKARYFGAEKRGHPEELDEGRTRAAGTPGPSPSAEIAFTEDLAVVGRALGRLSEDHRRVIVLRVVEARSFEDVARALGRTQNATRVLLSRARAALALEIDQLMGREDGA